MNKFLIKEIFKIYGGVSGLTERIIYENQAEEEEDNISVFSSATEKTFFLPKIDRNAIIETSPIKFFSKEKKYIIVARNGKAGLMNIIENIDFTINDHAYIFEIKKNFIGKIDLKYFILKYQKTFLDFVTSKDSNGTFSKEIAENYEVELPSIAIQNEILEEKKALENIKAKLENIINLLDEKNKVFMEGKSFLLGDLFLHFQGHQLTDKEIYDNVGSYPVLSGADNEPKGFINTPLFKDKKKLPCLIYQTKGNNEFKSKVVNGLFNANNTAVLYIKKSKKNIVNIDYIQLVIAHNMKLSISGQEGVSYIDTKILNTEIFLPSIEEQNRIVKKTSELAKIKDTLHKKIDSIDTQLTKQIIL